MIRIIARLIAAVIITIVFQCNPPDKVNAERSANCGKPEWLNTIIANVEQNGNKGTVIQYQYNNETMFSITPCINCADGMTVVYNCAGETKCQFGGIAGLNTCPDFGDRATNRKVIWSN